MSPRWVVTWLKVGIDGRAEARCFGPYDDFELANQRRRKEIAKEAELHYMPHQRARVYVAELDGSGWRP